MVNIDNDTDTYSWKNFVILEEFIHFIYIYILYIVFNYIFFFLIVSSRI